MIKEFFMKKMLERQLKNAPPEQKEMIMTMLERDPKMMEQIAKEMQAEIKKGGNQMTAAMKVLPKYQKQIQELMKDKIPNNPTAFMPNGKLKR